MIELEEMWGEKDEEDSPEDEEEGKKGKKAEKVKDTSAGFRIQLGTCRRRGEGGVKKVPILLAKDPLCWILRIGSYQVYPTSLVGVFEAIAQQTALELNDDFKIEDLVEETKAIEARIKEMGTILDKRFREYVTKKPKKK